MPKLQNVKCDIQSNFQTTWKCKIKLNGIKSSDSGSQILILCHVINICRKEERKKKCWSLLFHKSHQKWSPLALSTASPTFPSFSASFPFDEKNLLLKLLSLFALYSIEQLSQTDFWQPLTSSLQIFRRTDVLIHVIHACIADPLLCSTTSSTLIIDHLSPLHFDDFHCC